ncbi:ribonuclease HI [Campylobacterota bacterium]|nr:ribonuclease HI [Campylobacterota bacterium]
MKKVQIFADGSCKHKAKKGEEAYGHGGWCAIVRIEGNPDTSPISGGEKKTKSPRMELRAAIEGIKSLKEPSDITLVTDSEYVAKGINVWLDNWLGNKILHKKENTAMWEEYLQAAKGHHIVAKWVKGHSGHPENELCDKIAKAEADKQKQADSRKQ